MSKQPPACAMKAAKRITAGEGWQDEADMARIIADACPEEKAARKLAEALRKFLVEHRLRAGNVNCGCRRCEEGRPALAEWERSQ